MTDTTPQSAGETPAAPPDPWKGIQVYEDPADGCPMVQWEEVQAALATERQYHAAQTRRIEQLEAILRAMPDCQPCGGEGWKDGNICYACDGAPHIIGGTGKARPVEQQLGTTISKNLYNAHIAELRAEIARLTEERDAARIEAQANTDERCVAWHRDMALRFALDRDEQKHKARAAEASLLALQQQIQEWRSFAQFVYLSGGPVTKTDQELRAAVCDTHDVAMAEKDAELLALRAAHAQLREQRETLKRAAIALADHVDQTSECDHHRIACEDIGCVGAQVKAVRRAALAASPPHPETEGQ